MKKIDHRAFSSDCKITKKNIGKNKIKYTIKISDDSRYPSNIPYNVTITIAYCFENFEEELDNFIDFYINLNKDYPKDPANDYTEEATVSLRRMLTNPMVRKDSDLEKVTINFKDKEFLESENYSSEVKFLAILLLNGVEKISDGDILALEEYSKIYKETISRISEEVLANNDDFDDVFTSPVVHWSLYKRDYPLTYKFLKILSGFDDYHMNFTGTFNDVGDYYFKGLDLWLFMNTKQSSEETFINASKNFKNNINIEPVENFAQMIEEHSREYHSSFRIIENSLKDLVNAPLEALSKLDNLNKLQIIEFLVKFPSKLTPNDQVKVTDFILDEILASDKSTPTDAFTIYSKVIKKFPSLTSRELINVHNEIMSNYNSKYYNELYVNELDKIEMDDMVALEVLNKSVWKDLNSFQSHTVMEMLIQKYLDEGYSLKELRQFFSEMMNLDVRNSNVNKVLLDFKSSFILFYIEDFENNLNMPLQWCWEFFIETITDKHYLNSESDDSTMRFYSTSRISMASS